MHFFFRSVSQSVSLFHLWVFFFSFSSGFFVCSAQGVPLSHVKSGPLFILWQNWKHDPWLVLNLSDDLPLTVMRMPLFQIPNESSAVLVPYRWNVLYANSFWKFLNTLPWHRQFLPWENVRCTMKTNPVLLKRKKKVHCWLTALHRTGMCVYFPPRIFLCASTRPTFHTEWLERK